MKSREYLIDVFQDTVEKVESGKYKQYLKSKKLELDTIYLDYYEYTDNISVINEDCISTAERFSKMDKTCMLNMASYKRPGGGVKNGAMAQEEELARRSNLMWGLPQEYYPLESNEFIYTQDVEFFKDSYYNEVESFTCDIITMAAVNLNGLDKPRNYISLMTDKIDHILYVPYKNGCKNLVLSAFGCGVFKNDPEFVSSLFKDSLYKFGGYYDNITFSILNDRNSVGSNYQIFKDKLIN